MNYQKKFRKFRKYWILWNNWLIKNNIKPLNACLNFILNCKDKFDYIVIGCQDVNQLNQIINYKKNKILKGFYKIRVEDKRLYNPLLLRK